MEWRHYEERSKGTALVVKDGSPITASYEMGVVTTGRQRVFAGYFVRLTVPSGIRFAGEHEHSLLGALRKLDHSLAVVDLELRCVGIEPDFVESGLSAETGFGYVPGYEGAIHMMDVPPRATIAIQYANIDDLIREVVSRMQIDVHSAFDHTTSQAGK